MVDVEDVNSLMKAKSLQECQSICDEEGVMYARIFAEKNGRGVQEEKVFERLSLAKGEG